MKTLTKNIIIEAPPEKVFAFMDETGNTGMHMTKRSMPMMGGKLEIEWLSGNRTGADAKYRWKGKILGLTLDFSVAVTKWVKDHEKIWETIGEPKMLILSWYRMRLLLSPSGTATRTALSIDYETPKTLFGKILAFFLAGWYANWCLDSMLRDSKKALEEK